MSPGLFLYRALSQLSEFNQKRSIQPMEREHLQELARAIFSLAEAIRDLKGQQEIIAIIKRVENKQEKIMATAQELSDQLDEVIKDITEEKTAIGSISVFIEGSRSSWKMLSLAPLHPYKPR